MIVSKSVNYMIKITKSSLLGYTSVLICNKIGFTIIYKFIDWSEGVRISKYGLDLPFLIVRVF